MATYHTHQHVVAAVGAGASLDEALANAVAGLTDPHGHHGRLTFETFEVLGIKGTIAHTAGNSGKADRVQVTIQALGTHAQ